MSESALENKSCRHARANGWLARKLKTHNNKGAPDRMFLRDGNVLFVEFKDVNGELSKLQIYEHRQYRERGVEVHVIDDFETFKSLVA